MIVLEALFILPYFLLSAAEDVHNESFYPQINNTELYNTTNVSVIEEMHNTSFEKSKELVTDLLNLNDSSVAPPLNNSGQNATAQGTDNSNPNKLDDAEFLHLVEEEKNFPFFSKDFVARLTAWSKTLNNATRHCVKAKFSEITVIGKNLEINFPVFHAKRIDYEGNFLTLDTLHPVLVRKKSGHDLVNVAYLSILELWPLLLLCFSCAALSGMLVWLLDHRANSEQFPRRFWRGIFDGMWWAIVTMTTVGYGDKAPKSLFARLFATVWMITGIILLSMFTAQVSSRLTTQELKSDDHLFGKKIGVPAGLYDSDYTDYEMAYSIIEEISHPIKSTTDLTAKGLDSVVVFHCKDKEPSNSWEVLQFLPLCEIGASLRFYHDQIEIDAEQNFVNCMKAQMRVAGNGRKRVPRNESTNKVKESHSCRDLLGGNNDRLKFQFKWVYFKNLSQYLIPFGALLGTIILAFIVGTIWDNCCRKKKRNSYKKKGLEDGSGTQTSLMLQSRSSEGDDKPNAVAKDK